MPSTPSSRLSRYLSDNQRAGPPPNPSDYVSAGAALVTREDLDGLVKLLPQITAKRAQISDSARLQRRIAVLEQFFEESAPAGETDARRETAFVLYYFLKGYDLIPDSVPNFGLVDDAMLVAAVLQRNASALQAHWAQRRRPYPADL